MEAYLTSWRPEMSGEARKTTLNSVCQLSCCVSSGSEVCSFMTATNANHSVGQMYYNSIRTGDLPIMIANVKLVAELLDKRISLVTPWLYTLDHSATVLRSKQPLCTRARHLLRHIILSTNIFQLLMTSYRIYSCLITQSASVGFIQLVLSMLQFSEKRKLCRAVFIMNTFIRYIGRNTRK